MLNGIRVVLLAVGFAGRAFAQTPADSLVDRMGALNAVFRFRADDLRSDSVVIARCRLPTATSDSGAVAGLDQRFQRLLVRPDPGQVTKTTPCPVLAFVDPKLKVLWLQEMIEVARVPALGGPLSSVKLKQFEITFQLTMGPGYREYHTYVVAPTGGAPMEVGNRIQYKFDAWRVVEYRLAGWDFDWADARGHGFGVRR